MDNELHTSCSCTDYFHTVRYGYDMFEDGFPPELYVEMVTQDYASIWSRIILALQYIFTKKNLKSTIVSLIKHEDIPRIVKFFEKYRIEYNKNIKKIRNK